MVAILVALPVLGLVGCGGSKEPPPPPPVAKAPAPPPAPVAFRVTSIDLGKTVDAQKRVSAPSTTFAPADTIYVSVVTEGALPSATVGARWTYGGDTLVKEDTQTIAPTGVAATEFHIAKPSGWPPGKYKVEISVNGSAAGAREFAVQG